MKTLIDLPTLSIEEVTRQLKAVDDREEAPHANPVSIDGKLLFTEEQWLARQKEKQQEGSSLSKYHYQQPRKKSIDGGTSGNGDGKGGGGGGGVHKATHDDTCLNCGRCE
jgi:hypothetical protein